MKKIVKTILCVISVLCILAFISCKKSDSKKTVVKLGTCGSLIEDMLQPAKESLLEEGIDLQIVQFSDFVTPNRALDSGEIDLNAMQHRVFFANDTTTNGYKLTPIANTYLIPMNLYSNKVKSVSEIKDGDIIAIPNDVTNGGRAIKILEHAGLIKIREGAAFSPTLEDIESYNVKINISELAANIIPQSLDDVTGAIINGNFSLDFGIPPESAILTDPLTGVQEYWCLMVAKTADLADKEKVAIFDKVVKKFQSEDTKKFLETKQGSMIPVGWDEDILSQYK